MNFSPKIWNALTFAFHESKQTRVLGSRSVVEAIEEYAIACGGTAEWKDRDWVFVSGVKS